MDIYCKRCGEPWDIAELHDTPDELPFDEARERFYAEGCGVFDIRCEVRDTARGRAMGVLSELLGDDVDGLASTLDDLEYLGQI